MTTLLLALLLQVLSPTTGKPAPPPAPKTAPSNRPTKVDTVEMAQPVITTTFTFGTDITVIGDDGKARVCPKDFTPYVESLDGTNTHKSAFQSLVPGMVYMNILRSSPTVWYSLICLKVSAGK